MKLEIKTISESEKEYIEIGCHKVDDRVNEIVQFVKMRQGSVDAFKDEKMYQILIADILNATNLVKDFMNLRQCFPSASLREYPRP